MIVRIIGWGFVALMAALLLSFARSVRPRDGLFNNITDDRVAIAAHRSGWYARSSLRLLRLNDVVRMSLARDGFCVLDADASWPAADGAQIECRMLTPMRGLAGTISQYVWVHRYRRVGRNWYRLVAVHRSITK